MNTDANLMQRIATDPAIMDGQPVIRGTRLSVEYILNRLAHGDTAAILTTEYAGLLDEDIRACLLYASRALNPIDALPLSAEAA